MNRFRSAVSAAGLVLTGALLASVACSSSHHGGDVAVSPQLVPLPCPRPISGWDLLTAPIVLLGETHGTQEIPEAFGDLVCTAARVESGTILIGLEIFRTSQPAIDSFMDGAGGAHARTELLAGEFWQRDYQDGRSSAAMVALLERLRLLRSAGRKVIVVAMDDAAAPTATIRDARMTDLLNSVIQALHPARTLILVGDVHSRILPGYPWSPADTYQSIGSLLKAQYESVEGLRVMSGGGSAWTCQSAEASECGAHTLTAREVSGSTPRVELQPESIPQLGWSGTLYLSSLSASTPARLAH